MRFIFVGLLALSIVGCSKAAAPSLSGKFYQGVSWIEFAADGSVRHGDSGDKARFTVEGDRVVISDGTQQTTGRLTAPDTVEFPGGATRVAGAFEGIWVVRADTAKAPTPAAGAPTGPVNPKVLVGEWGAPGDPGNLTFREDGTFKWGATITGNYQLLDATRVRMTFFNSGRPTGQMDNTYAVQGILLRLVMQDGSKVVYQRVK